MEALFRGDIYWLLKPKTLIIFQDKFNTMNKLVLIGFFFSTFILGSCNKNDTPDPTYTDHILRAAWKFDKAMSGGTDVSAFLNACYKDNTTTFVASGSGTLDEGATKCNSSDPQSVNFTWNFTNDGHTLNVSAGIVAGQSGAFTVIKLDETQMILEGSFSTSSGTITGQIYFKH
jgi:hypothetical protein